MRKIIFLVLACAVIAPCVVSAQMTNMNNVRAEDRVMHNSMFTMGRFISMKPVDDYLAGYGFKGVGDNPMMYGICNMNKSSDRLYWGIATATTLGEGIFDLLSPNMLKRTIDKSQGNNDKAEFNMMFAEGLFEYKFLDLGGFSLGAGCGFGFGGASITLLGTNSVRYRKLSFLVNPFFTANYYFFRESGAGVIVSFWASYDYYPNAAWWPADAGNLPTPANFDMSGTSMWLSIGIPTNETPGK